MAYFLFEEPKTAPFRGFHGTSESRAERILREGFAPSTGEGEWLGHGIYFWDSIDAAWFWAEKYFRERPAVVSGIVMLGYCLDLDNAPDYAEFLAEVYEELVAEAAAKGECLPEDDGAEKYLACLLYNRAGSCTYPPTDSLICTFPSGGPIYAGANVQRRTRRMYCLRTDKHISFPEREYRRNS